MDAGVSLCYKKQLTGNDNPTTKMLCRKSEPDQEPLDHLRKVRDFPPVSRFCFRTPEGASSALA